MLDKIQDFSNTLLERIRSPFIGSFIITWSIYHWKVFVFLLYNEPLLTIDNRLNKVDLYIKSLDDCQLFIYPILWTFLILIIYALFNSLALFIKLFYEEWASPFIQKFMNNEKIIEREKYNKVKDELYVQRKSSEEHQLARLEAETTTRNSLDALNRYRNESIPVAILSINQIFTKRIDYSFRVRILGVQNVELKVVSFDYDIMYSKNKNNEQEEFTVSKVYQTKDGRFITFEIDEGDIKKKYFLLKWTNSFYFGVDSDENRVEIVQYE